MIDEFMYTWIHLIDEFMYNRGLTFHTSNNHTVRIDFPGKFLPQHDGHWQILVHVMWCLFLGLFFFGKFHTIQFSFDCATQWYNFRRSKFWLHIYRHSWTISSLTTNLELNDEHCSCLLASFSKARIRCLLPLARLMSVLLQYIR